MRFEQSPHHTSYRGFLVSISTYRQPVKDSARRQVLERSVATLTTERERSAIVAADEFDETLDYAISYLERCQLVQPGFRTELQRLAADWHAFQESVVGVKRASDLRILYLCGPEPSNDLSVLRELGVIPQNIWAIESDEGIYKEAVEQLKREGACLRIHHGGLDTFFKSTNQRFDIVYIDACGPLPGGRPNTVSSPLQMFRSERLEPLGVLITNFSQPPKEKIATYERLLCYYFSPRYRDCPPSLFAAGADPEIAHSDPDYLLPFVHDCFDDVYSEFITRFLIDIGREILPYARIFDNGDLRRKYFSPKVQLKAACERARANPSSFENLFSEIGDIYLNRSSYPVLSFLELASKDKELQSLLQPFLSDKCAGSTLKDSFFAGSLLTQIIEGHWDVASQEMLRALAQSWFDFNGGIFCDVPLPNLMVNSLFGIYGHPYLANPRQSVRLTYTAKSTKMYTDMLLLDQCRYYFDYLPTMDLVPSSFQSPPYQLILRTCLDRMERHDFGCSAHPFAGAALGGMGEFSCAQWHDFSPRLEIGDGNS